MESAMVNARVPQAKRDLGLSVLESIGATTTELINGAFDYLIENRALPQGQCSKERDVEAFREFVKGATLQIEWSQNADELDYQDAFEKEAEATYEALN